MATTDILGLFMSPEQYQAQQMAQQQAGEQQRAFNFAGLDPRQQANYGVFLGAQQLGRGFGGLLGVQDPQLQRIRQRQEIMQSINPADPQSLMAGIQRAAQTNDQELALTLTDFMNKQGSEMALAQQRKAQAARERTQALPAGLQEAARVAEIERTLAKLDKDEDAIEIKALTEEKARLQKSAKAATTTEKQRDAEAYANTISSDPESAAWQEAYKTRLDRLQLGKDSLEKTTDAMANATALANASGATKDSAEWTKVFASELRRLTNKDTAEKYSPEAQKLIDAGYIPGSPGFVSQMDKMIAKDLREKDPAAKVSPEAQKLIDAGYVPGSPAFVSKMDEVIEKDLRAKDIPEKYSPEARKLVDAGYIPGSPAFVSKMDEVIEKDLRDKNIPEKYSADARKLIDAGYVPGSPAFVAKMDEIIAKDLRSASGKPPSFGVDREAISEEFFEKPFSELTKEQKVKVNAVKEEREGTVAQKGAAKLFLPGEKGGLKSITDFRNDVFSTIKPFRDTVNASDAAIQNIDDSIKTGNFVSFNASRVQLAKALGDSTLSRRDIEQAGGDPSLIGGFYDATSTLFTGTPSIDTQKKIKATLQAIRKVARKKAQDELDTSRDLGLRAGYKTEDLDRAFKVPEITGKGGVTPKPVDGGGGAKPKTVPFNSLPK